ncbi:DUF554 domain-containing protein [Hazenella coriacea]|uniref:DUF554 domain-containing protein n=1 Tax=Hazenella coriacea TaxID=1179467 RepID=A0A4R3LB26_9BACL|nr:DUF554 domain-containing protein [Hazenella coriacea]TCS95494.1 hypothetical protein EDD58_10267 [Hazenella coriacea]
MLLGTIVNAVAIIIGALLGIIFKKMSDQMNQTMMSGIGLVTIVIGLSMALKSNNLFLVLLSIVLGGVVGTLLQMEEHLEKWSQRLERKFGHNNQFASSFVTGVLVFCVGPMAILGGLDSGLRGQHDILFTKSLLDGVTATIFSSALGIGVLFSAIPVFLYQGLITILATWITQFIDQAMLDLVIQQMTATGGVLILAIGCNLLGITKIKVANLLPALPLVVIGAPYIQL